MKLYRPLSFTLAVVFAVVGILFISIPDGVLGLFNAVSPQFGLQRSPLTGFNFYLILAAGYMYIVTVLAYMMYRHPGTGIFPLLLAHAKLASSLISLSFFLFHSAYLIYLTNFIVDGFIGGLALFFYLKIRRDPNWAS